MFGNVLKFYYNSTVPIVPVASLYTFLEHQLSGFQYHLYLVNKQEPRGEARHKSQYCLMFLIYRRLTLKLTSGICRFICLFVFTEGVFLVCLLVYTKVIKRFVVFYLTITTVRFVVLYAKPYSALWSVLGHSTVKTGCFLENYKHITRSCEHCMIFPISSPESALWTK